MNVQVIPLQISAYRFDGPTNPYTTPNAKPPIELKDLAQTISSKINELAGPKKLLVRGVQSAKHVVSKAELVDHIVSKGLDYANPGEPNTIFAAPYDQTAVEHILEGFHKYKPKSDESPQQPVDLWSIYDAQAYKNIQYLHPRHNVIAEDKWQRLSPKESGLIAVVVLN